MRNNIDKALMSLVYLDKHERSDILSGINIECYGNGFQRSIIKFLTCGDIGEKKGVDLKNSLLDYLEINDELGYNVAKDIGCWTDITKDVIDGIRRIVVHHEASFTMGSVFMGFEESKDPIGKLLEFQSETNRMLSSGLIAGGSQIVSLSGDTDLDEIFSKMDIVEGNRMLTNTVLDKLTAGGLTAKTLNIFMAGTNVGKTFTMINLSANMSKQGRNVLYISLEMSEVEITKRVMSNFTKKPTYFSNMDSMRKEFKRHLSEQSFGSFDILDMPSENATIPHIKAIVGKHQQRTGKIYDVIFVDYLSLIRPTRSDRGSTRSDQLIGDVAKQLRSWAKELGIPVVSAAQIQRNAQERGSKIELVNLAESIQLANDSDLIVALEPIVDMLNNDNIYFTWKVLKTRYTLVKDLSAIMIHDNMTFSTYDTNGKIYQNFREYDVDMLLNESKRAMELAEDDGTIVENEKEYTKEAVESYFTNMNEIKVETNVKESIKCVSTMFTD